MRTYSLCIFITATGFQQLMKSRNMILTWSRFPSTSGKQPWQYSCKHRKIIYWEKRWSLEQIFGPLGLHDGFKNLTVRKLKSSLSFCKIQGEKAEASPLNLYEHGRANNTQRRACRKCDQFHPCGFLGRLKINVMRGDSNDRSLQRNRLLQRAGSQLASLSVPEIAGIKLPHLECTDVQYQQSFCRLKSFSYMGS